MYTCIATIAGYNVNSLVPGLLFAERRFGSNHKITVTSRQLHCEFKNILVNSELSQCPTRQHSGALEQNGTGRPIFSSVRSKTVVWERDYHFNKMQIIFKAITGGSGYDSWGERKCGTLKPRSWSLPLEVLYPKISYIYRRCTCELWNSGEVQNGVNETKINGLLMCNESL